MRPAASTENDGTPRGSLPPDLDDGADAGLRKRVRRRPRRGVSDEGGDRLPLGDVVGSEQGGGELTGLIGMVLQLSGSESGREAPGYTRRWDAVSDRQVLSPSGPLLARARGK